VNAPRITWPNGHAFAFSIFDDPDAQRLERGRLAYDFLSDLGFRTTKGVWPLGPVREPSDQGGTCGDPAYLAWCLDLQARGFEMGYHNATSHTSTREETEVGLKEFARLFGHKPRTMAQHYFCDESLYWGERRVSGWRRPAYNVATRGRRRASSFGHIEGHPLFWGDLCSQQITYLRNFVFPRINTLAACPMMPYHDPLRPFVPLWYAGTDGSDIERSVRALNERAQDQLEAEGGACILYTHFGHGYVRDGVLDPRFKRLMERLRERNGWFAPVGTLLDHIRASRPSDHILTDDERASLERRWLWDKLVTGSS
jgi:hypothetical protein